MVASVGCNLCLHSFQKMVVNGGSGVQYTFQSYPNQWRCLLIILAIAKAHAAISMAVVATVQIQGQGQASPETSQAAPVPKRLYIEERIKKTTGTSVHCDSYGNCFGHEGDRSRNISLEVTREVMKKCPSVLNVTDNRDAADYDLRISPGSSTLYKQNGDAAYVSPTRYKVSNLAKDVCEYVESHP